MKPENFAERLTEDCGKAFEPSRYVLKSKNEVVVSPYATYDLFFEITFKVLQKLGLYEDLGTPEELAKAVRLTKPEPPIEAINPVTEQPLYVCPNCKKILVRTEIYGITVDEHCVCCGQAILWPEEEVLDN